MLSAGDEENFDALSLMSWFIADKSVMEDDFDSVCKRGCVFYSISVLSFVFCLYFDLYTIHFYFLHTISPTPFLVGIT